MNTLQKTYRAMHKISNIICKILAAMIVLVVVLNLTSVLLQILNRHLIVRLSDYSISWTEELARITMVWFAYLALPLCYREGSMAQLDMVYERMGKHGRLVLYLLSRLLMAIFLVIVIYFGTELVASRWMFKSSMLHLPGYMMYTAPVVGSFLVGLELLTEVIGVGIGELVPFNAGEKRDFPEHSEPEADGVVPQKGEKI